MLRIMNFTWHNPSFETKYLYVHRKKAWKAIHQNVYSGYFWSSMDRSWTFQTMDILFSILHFSLSSKLSIVASVAFIYEKNPISTFLKGLGNYDQVCTIKFPKQK